MFVKFTKVFGIVTALFFPEKGLWEFGKEAQAFRKLNEGRIIKFKTKIVILSVWKMMLENANFKVWVQMAFEQILKN